MAISLGSNIAALQAQRQLAESSGGLARIFERLSSGRRINRASDDAAGLAVSSDLNAKQRIYTRGIRNLNDGISALSIAEEALTGLSGIVIRQRELASQSANGVFSSTQRISLNREAQELAREYQRILEGTQFNGLRLLDGSNGRMTLQAGIGSNAMLSIETLEQGSVTVNNPSTTVIAGTTFGTGDGNPNIGTLTRNMNLFVLDYNNDGYDDLLAVGLQNAGSRVNYGLTLFRGGASGLTEQADVSDFVDYGSMSFSDVFVTFNSTTNNLRIGVADGFEATFDLINIPTNGALPSSTADQFTLAQVFNDTAPVPSVQGDFNNDGISDTAAFSTGVLTAAGKSITTTLSNLISTPGGFETLEQNDFDLTTKENSLNALDYLATVLETLIEARGRIGVSLSRIEAASLVLSDTKTQIAAAENRIVDADIGADASELLRKNILQQTGAAVLAQANIQPSLALLLLGVN